MEVRLASDSGVERRDVEDLPKLLAGQDGLVWVDVATCDDEAVQVLRDVFGFHPLAIQDCLRRNPVPKVHVYPDHTFVVLHAPEPGAGGHVHYIELDQFVGPNFLVTVHGPLNPAVDPAAATVEAAAVAKRLETGRLRPTSAHDLFFAMVTALTGRLRNYLTARTEDVWKLEQRVTGGHLGDAEEFLEEMFRVRHGLLTLRTMAALSREVFGRMGTLAVFGQEQGQYYLTDLVDQFERLRTMADGQKDYLHGVIEFYQTRTNTKMTIAAERLAVIAAVTLPVTALSSVLGMNVIVNDHTDFGLLALLVVIMATMSAVLLLWAKRRGWW